MNRRVRALTLITLGLLLVACASASGGTARARVRPPELLTRTRPDLVAVAVPPNGVRPSLVVDIQVVVKPDGTPDMTTLELSGPGAAANLSSITSWLQTAEFKPGTQGGIPVAAVFHLPITAIARTVRVR